MAPIEEKFFEIEKLVREKKEIWKYSSFFFTTKDEYIRVHKGKFHKHMEFQENATIARISRPDRGKILDIFAKIEYLVNQLIIVKILGFLSKRVFLIDEILQNVEFFSRIRILQKWGILDNSETNNIIQLKQVRNGFAHKWSASDIMYKGKSLEDKANFEIFRKDLINVWNMIIEKYILEEEKNIEYIITTLKNTTTSNT